MRTFFRCSVRDLFLIIALAGVLLALRAPIAQAIDAAWSVVVYVVTGDGLIIQRYRDDLQQLTTVVGSQAEKAAHHPAVS